METATGEYFRESDAFGRFIDEECVATPRARVRASALREAYNRWAVEQGMQQLDQMTLAEHMKEHGFERKRSNGFVYIGVGLAAAGEQAAEREDDQGETELQF